MKLQPRSSARCSAASESESDCAPHEPPIAHAPKPISEQLNPDLPNERYFIAQRVHDDRPEENQLFSGCRLQLVTHGLRVGFARIGGAEAEIGRGIDHDRFAVALI